MTLSSQRAGRVSAFRDESVMIIAGVGGSAGGQKVQRVAPPGALVATA
jgi:hypothetical protein